LSFSLNRYTLLARVQPALLVALPLALLTLAWVPGGFLDRGVLWGLIVAGGGTGFLARLARDRGVSKQEGLFDEWGGRTTTRMLRYKVRCQDSTSPDWPNNATVNRWHSKLKDMNLTGAHIPQDEQEEGPESDDVYAEVVGILSEQTRDQTKFEVVFEENINYGFRRNLWAMWLIGITIAAFSFAAVVALIVADFLVDTPATASLSWYEKLLSSNSSTLPIRLVSGLVILAVLYSWVLIINKNWVKVADERYARRLLAQIDVLHQDKGRQRAT